MTTIKVSIAISDKLNCATKLNASNGSVLLNIRKSWCEWI